MMSWRMILPPVAAGPQPARRRRRECPSPLRLHADSGSRPVGLEVLPTQPPSPALRLAGGFGRATRLLPLEPLMTTSCRPHLLDVSGESHSRGIWGAFSFCGCGDSEEQEGLGKSVLSRPVGWWPYNPCATPCGGPLTSGLSLGGKRPPCRHLLLLTPPSPSPPLLHTPKNSAFCLLSLS